MKLLQAVQNALNC